MKMNLLLIQNYKILILFQYFQAKLQGFDIYCVLLRTAQATEKILGNRLGRKSSFFHFCSFTMLQKQQ